MEVLWSNEQFLRSRARLVFPYDFHGIGHGLAAAAKRGAASDADGKQRKNGWRERLFAKH